MLDCEQKRVAEDQIIEQFDTIQLSTKDKIIVEEHERLSQHLIYEIIRRDGIEELMRPFKSLFLSGVGAGILVSFSFVCMAVLQSFLPNHLGHRSLPSGAIRWGLSWLSYVEPSSSQRTPLPQ